MNTEEIYNAVRFSHDKAEISGSATDMVAAFRTMKKDKYDIDCMVTIANWDTNGTKPRKVDLTDGKSMARVFRPFASAYSDRLVKPMYDEKGDALIGTDGRMMLVSRIPKNLKREDAAANGFEDKDIVRWDWCCGDLTHDEYTLSSYVQMAEICKGGKLHGLLQTVGALTKAYNHEGDGVYRYLYLHIGKKCYNAVFVSELVDGLFRLGCHTVKVCEQMDISGGVAETKPLHLFGIGAANHDGTSIDAKGVVMPIRVGYGESVESLGGIVFPVENGKAAAA